MHLILKYLEDYKKESILAPLLKMSEAILDLFVPLVVASIIDQGIGKSDKGHIMLMCLTLLLLAAVGLGISFIAQYFAAKAAVMSTAHMKEDLFAHIQTFSYTEMDTIGSSTFITRLTSDMNQIQNGVNLCLRLLLRSPFIVFGSMIMAFTIDFKAAFVFAVIIPVLGVVVFGVMLVTKPLYKRVQSGLDRLLLLTRENLSGVRVIRAFHREDREKEAFFQANAGLTNLQLFAGKISGLTNPLTLILINLAIVVLIYVGALRVDSGALTQGQLVALYNYMASILVELIKMANFIVSMTKALACAGRLQEVFDTKTSMTYGDLETSGNNCMTYGTLEASGNNCMTYGDLEANSNNCMKNEGLEASETVLQFDHVSFTYSGGGDPALQDITFAVKKGETIGIIGGTGSGKSTLVNLIPRFYDVTRGSLLLFGQDIRRYSEESLRSMISIVPQKAQLFKGTIRDNLTFGYENATEEEIEEALEVSQAKEFVDTKEGRLEALVEQGGRNLSGGQKQRLTLARALVRPAPILIMDDSASALDFATDAKLRSALRNRKNRQTVFIVSQRTSSIMNADHILVLDDGELAGMGTHEELLDHCDVYREIYLSQFKKEA